MIRTTLLSTTLVLAGTMSFAGNLSEPVIVAPVAPMPVVVAPSMDWTGFYVGGQYSNGEADLSGDLDGDGDDDDDDAALDASTDVDGFGLHAGYLRDLGTFVVGGELGYEVLGADGGNDADVLRLKGIAGYDLGRFMPYITAGAANLDFDDGSGDTIGFYGVGGMYSVTDNVRLGAEYLVHDGDDFDNSGVDLEVDTLSLRASYSF